MDGMGHDGVLIKDVVVDQAIDDAFARLLQAIVLISFVLCDVNVKCGVGRGGLATSIK